MGCAVPSVVKALYNLWLTCRLCACGSFGSCSGAVCPALARRRHDALCRLARTAGRDAFSSSLFSSYAHLILPFRRFGCASWLWASRGGLGRNRLTTGAQVSRSSRFFHRPLSLNLRWNGRHPSTNGKQLIWGLGWRRSATGSRGKSDVAEQTTNDFLYHLHGISCLNRFDKSLGCDHN